MKKAALVVALMMALPGCALTNKGEALAVRWYTPEDVKPRLTSAPASAEASTHSGPSLELGRISSGVNLREKIAYRDAAYEVGFYDDRRWTERPEVFVRRQLSRTLFEERSLRRSLAGEAPVLEVEVLAFEEIRGAAPAARVQLRIILHDDRHTLLEKTVTVDRAVPPGAKGFDGLVQAMSGALDAAAEEVARETERALTLPRP